MKKTLALAFLLILTGSGHSQVFTTVTATLTDGNGQVWANAYVSAVLVPPFGNPSPLNNQGQPPITPVQAFANGSGTFSFPLDDNTVLQPRGSTWQFTVCPNASVSNCSTSIQVVHGISMNLSANISNDLVPVVVNTAPTILRAYNDAEALGGQGATYWRTTDNTLRGFNGTIWVPIGTGGVGGNPPWNTITGATGNLTLPMNNFTTVINMGATGSTGAAFGITDSPSNTGTNYLFQVATASGSTAKPVSFCQGGTNNCIEFNAAATLQALGSAIITATQVINTGPGVGVVQLGSNGSGSVSQANTIKLTGNNNAAYISENAGTLSKVLLGGQLGCATFNLFQSVSTTGTNTCFTFGSISAGPLYGFTGSQFNTQANPAHFVKGQQALTAGTATVTLSGAAVYTSNATYYCFGNDLTATAVTQIVPSSGTQFTINGTGTDNIVYLCYGQ